MECNEIINIEIEIEIKNATSLFLKFNTLFLLRKTKYGYSFKEFQSIIIIILKMEIQGEALNMRDLAAKCRSKSEVYYLLKRKAEVYMPPI